MYVLWRWKFFFLYLSKLLQLNLSNYYPCNQKLSRSLCKFDRKHVRHILLYGCPLPKTLSIYFTKNNVSWDVATCYLVHIYQTTRRHIQEGCRSLICYDLLDIFLFSYVMYCITLYALRLQSRKMLTLNIWVHVSLTNISLRKQCFTHPVLWHADTFSWKPQISMIIQTHFCCLFRCLFRLRRLRGHPCIDISYFYADWLSTPKKKRTQRYFLLCFNYL